MIPLLYEAVVRRALDEDLGVVGDLTTDAVVDPDLPATGRLEARQAGVVAGVEPALDVFRLLDPSVAVDVHRPDASRVEPGETIATLAGAARALLTGERTALNLLTHLSGVATATRQVVDAVAGWSCRVTATRKTLPGLRALQRAAVRAGGGADHRFGLNDAVLLKDNHLVAAGGVTEAVARARRSVGHLVTIEVEVDTLDQLDEAVAAGAGVVLLDNMPPDLLRRAVARVPDGVVTEASGGITPDDAPQVAATGVDVISLGWLTHSAPALDVALELQLPQA